MRGNVKIASLCPKIGSAAHISLLSSTFAVLLSAASGGASAQQPALHWQPWGDAAFSEARQQHKFVLLDLEAVWCHWCHVMDGITYTDPAVIRLLQSRYVLVKVDQDSRPDISNRYQDYGWPATVVFAADGSEIVKRQGYMPPRPMASMLQAIIDDPSPGPSVEKELALHPAASSGLSVSLFNHVRTSYGAQYDKPNGGWGFSHKYLDGDSVEYALRLAGRGDSLAAQRATATLHDATALLDPVWGGAYQYSVGGHWSEPHYEKLISIQAVNMREYSLAFAQTHNGEDLAAAQSIHRYVHDFLSDGPSGVFFVSQDADLHDGEDNEPYFKLNDQGRRALGIPRVDKHVYARENGWMISAMCDLYAVSGDTSALDQAKRAAHWILQHRSIAGGGFRHDDADASGPYLGDTLAMGRAYLALYNVTGERQYLDSAESASRFIVAHFAPLSPGTGYVTSPTRTDASYRPHPDRDENISLVRFESLLSLADGNENDHSVAKEAMRYLSAPAVASRPLSAGVLLANDDFSLAPLHIAVLGSPQDPSSTALHTAALRALTTNELVQWLDPNAPSAQPTDIVYPKLNHAALFLCTAHACSTPIVHPEYVAGKVHRALLQPQ